MDAAGTVITYEVDGLGRRVKRTKSGVSERYLWDGSRIAAVLDNAGAVLRRFVYATSGYVPDAILEGAAGTLYLVVKDERGSVRQLIDPAGAVAEKYDYDEWGKELPGAPAVRKSLFGFAGGIYDPDTGLVRFGARDYDPVVGRWTTKDPSRFGGGTNFYEYANSDPVNYVDVDGRHPVLIALAVLVVYGVFAPSDTAQAPADVGMMMTGASMLPGLGLGLAGGTLTGAERAEIQSIADKFGTNIEVVGSRAAGRGRNINSPDLPVGKGPGTRSDIDFRISGEADIASGGALSNSLSCSSKGAGNIVSSSLPQVPGKPPVITFTPK